MAIALCVLEILLGRLSLINGQLLEVAEGMHYLHSQQVIHGDITDVRASRA
jgi:serine/threonine protein kinase